MAGTVAGTGVDTFVTGASSTVSAIAGSLLSFVGTLAESQAIVLVDTTVVSRTVHRVSKVGRFMAG